MTREQAKILSKLSKKDLEKINYGYAKHYEILKAFADGAEIEINIDGAWRIVDIPNFEPVNEYRLNPNGPWKPKDGETFFTIYLDGDIEEEEWDEEEKWHKDLFKLGLCYRTREEAEAAVKRMHAAFKGEQTLSKTEKVESLDGHELSDAEKGVIRILRRCKVETMWNCPFVYLERQDTLRTCETGILFKFESGAKASEFGDLADDVIAEAEERREKGEPSW